MAKRITRQLINDSKLYEGSVERTIEMIVDSICNHDAGIGLQFWKDVTLYGLSEAISYLKGYCPVTSDNGDNYIKLYETLESLKAENSQITEPF